MEQQIQQPNQQLNQTSSDETKRAKSRILKIVLIAFGAILLIVGGIIVWLGVYSDLFDTRGKLNEKIQRNFPIQAEEQTCIVDADCAAVYADCSYCRCTAVNKQYEPKYQRSQLCENYEGVLCDSDCFPERQVAKCLNKHCVLSSEQPTGITDVPTNWQTYRSEEFGFEVKYPENWDYGVLNERLFAFSNVKEPEKQVIVTIGIMEAHYYESSWDNDVSNLFEELRVKKRGEIVWGKIIAFTKISDEVVDGRQAVRFTSKGGNLATYGWSSSEEVLVEDKKALYYFVMAGRSRALIESNKDIFNQILSTFRFVE